jgi:hypothetical protein
VKRILLIILVTGVLLLGACGGNPNKHYVNEELGYSIDYPKEWFLEEVNPTRTGIRPGDSASKQIQIDAYIGSPSSTLMPDALLATSYETKLWQALKPFGFTDLNISVNKRGTEKWDWEIAFTVIYEDTLLQGGEFIKETESITYTIFFLQSEDWPEGQEVINSFSLVQ